MSICYKDKSYCECSNPNCELAFNAKEQEEHRQYVERTGFDIPVAFVLNKCKLNNTSNQEDSNNIENK